MSVPGLVEAALGEESVAVTVDLGGDDALYVSPTRTLVYRSEGLLSDESVEEFPHDAERVTVSEGRRKSSIELDYGLDGTKTLRVPTSKLDDALHSTLAGVLNASGVTGPGETVLETFRFSDLTIVVTSDRIVKHIGSAVWDEEYDEFHYDDVVGLDFEEGSVAMQVVLSTPDRRERFKAPNQEARLVRERIETAILDHHDIESVDDLGPTEDETGGEGADSDAVAGAESAIGFDQTVEPLVEPDPDSARKPAEEGPTVDAEAGEQRATQTGDVRPDPTTGSAASAAETGVESDPMADAGFEPAATGEDVAIDDRLEAIEATLEQHTALLEAQGDLVERLIEELRRQ